MTISADQEGFLPVSKGAEYCLKSGGRNQPNSCLLIKGIFHQKTLIQTTYFGWEWGKGNLAQNTPKTDLEGAKNCTQSLDGIANGHLEERQRRVL